MFQRILVPLDGSEGAERAIPVAARIAHASEGTIVFVRVIPPPTRVGTYAPVASVRIAVKSEAFEKDLADAANYLADTIAAYAGDLTSIATEEESLAGHKLTVTSGVSVSTDVAGTIIKLAGYAEGAEHTRGYHLIAMATHGRSGLQRLVMGSVTEHILGATKLPLLIVRPHETKTQPEGTDETTKAEVAEVEVQSWAGLL